MTPQFEYSQIANPEDIQQLGNIIDQCFIGSGDSEPYFNRIGRENFRVIRLGELVGGLATISSFLANHRSQIEKVRWKGSPVDFLTLLLPEQTVEPWFIERWMLRIVDVAKALEKRGYSQAIQTELHLEVEDDLIAENNGRFILSVANGRGEVSIGGLGELKLDIKGLAPLYKALFTPHQLQLMGKLDATETSISVATQLFAGASPWLADHF